MVCFMIQGSYQDDFKLHFKMIQLLFLCLLTLNCTVPSALAPVHIPRPIHWWALHSLLWVPLPVGWSCWSCWRWLQPWRGGSFGEPMSIGTGKQIMKNAKICGCSIPWNNEQFLFQNSFCQALFLLTKQFNRWPVKRLSFAQVGKKTDRLNW